MFDESIFKLGKICKYGHEYENSGKALRYKSNRDCLQCSIEREQDNFELRKKQKSDYQKTEKGKEVSKKSRRKWNEKNPDYYKSDERKDWERRYKSQKIKNNLNLRIECNLRGRINKVLKNINKSKHTMELIGCTIEFLKVYFESKFTNGMSWDNYGKWHIDHIKPCALFNLSDPEQQKECFHYTNLQPLWAIDNLKKGSKYNA